MDVIIWGTGRGAEDIITCVKEDCRIIAYVDNDQTRWGNKYHDSLVVAPKELISMQFDYLIVAVAINYESIVTQLAELMIDRNKTITPFSFDHAEYSKWRELFYLEELCFIELNRKMEDISLYVQNMEYEVAAKIQKRYYRFPQIADWKATISEIVEKGKSLSRFGDGELDLALGRGNSLQERDKVLSLRLKEVLTSDLENLLIAIPDVYGSMEGRTEEFKKCFRHHLANGGREQVYALLDFERTYFDAFITRPYKDFTDKSMAEDKFEAIKQIWKDRDITIIEGEWTRLGLGNDLLASVKACERILCPSINAFQKYNLILQAAKKVDKSRLILIALGAAATVLAYDLAKEGYQALDIGHIDIEYEWFIRGENRKVPIPGKYVNEVPGGRIVKETGELPNYSGEVIAKIL